MSRPSPEVNKRYDQSPKGKYRAYKNVAARRGIEFKLSPEEFASFWQRPCYYCSYPIHTVGIDRIDSSKGYEQGNIVSACKFCNQAKSDLTQARFFDLCKQVCITHGLL